MKKLNLLLVVFLLLASFEVFCEEKLEYPELLVAPKASERLLLEATSEGNNFLNGYDIYVATTLATTIGGVYSMLGSDSKNPDNEAINYLTIGVGGAFTALGTYLGVVRTPYRDAYAPIKKMGEGSLKAKLIKERMAEERIDEIATFNKRLRFFTGIAQVGLGVALLATNSTRDEVNNKDIENKKAIYAGSANIAAALVNFLMPHPSEIVSSRQKSYKKKIYSYVLPTPYRGGAGLVAGIIF